MHDSPDPRLRNSAQIFANKGDPDFQRIYARAAGRAWWRWSGVGLAAVAAAVLAVILTWPAPPPDFHHQISAFVELVYWD